MISLVAKNKIMDQFTKAVETTAEEVRGRIQLFSYYDAGVYDTVRNGIHDIKKMIERQIPEEVQIDAVASHIMFSGNVISVTMKNKFEDSKVKFRVKFPIVVRTDASNDSLYDECVIGMFNVYQDLVEDALMRTNVEEFNAVLAGLTKEASLDYRVAVVTPYMYSGKKIAVMTDDEVVFVCDKERIFDINNISVMQVASETITQESIDEAKKQVADQFATAQTTAEFVENKGFALIQYVCDLSKLKKPLSYMKKIASKNIQNNKVMYDGLYYYLKDDVFALVEAKGGAAEVVLSPIDVNTFKRVEGIDVLGAVKAE